LGTNKTCSYKLDAQAYTSPGHIYTRHIQILFVILKAVGKREGGWLKPSLNFRLPIK
jgi:hypothetical protein